MALSETQGRLYRQSHRESAEIAALAHQVVTMLGGRRLDRSEARVTTGARTLLAAVRSRARFDAAGTLADLRRLALSDATILEACIPRSARALGIGWLDDTLGFAEVTVASARLQSLLPALSPPLSRDVGPVGQEAEGRAALLVLAPGDHHTLGAQALAAMLRRRGLVVRLAFGTDAPTLQDMVQQDPYDLVLFSCATSEKLAFFSGLVSDLRGVRSMGTTFVLGGNVLDREDDLQARTGVDLVTNDIRAALAVNASRCAQGAAP